MALILLGRFHSERALPPYLLEENHAVLRERLDRLELVTGDLDGYLAGVPDAAFSRFNLSNLFDWFSQARLVASHRDIVRVASDGARLCWWNTLAVRHLPPEVTQIVPADDRARDLLARDRFIYAQFQIGVVSK
jgi:S-adenosylmethionine-diacylglycerol 3-amino-3-carboxypropyl transferase